MNESLTVLAEEGKESEVGVEYRFCSAELMNADELRRRRSSWDKDVLGHPKQGYKWEEYDHS